MLRAVRSLRDDSGFSLSELLIVCGLLGLVIGGAYAFSFAVNRGSQVSEIRQRIATQKSTAPSRLSRLGYIMQSLAIDHGLRLQYRLDRDLATANTVFGRSSR